MRPSLYEDALTAAHLGIGRKPAELTSAAFHALNHRLVVIGLAGTLTSSPSETAHELLDLLMIARLPEPS